MKPVKWGIGRTEVGICSQACRVEISTSAGDMEMSLKDAEAIKEGLAIAIAALKEEAEEANND